MRDVLSACPTARHSLFARYHIGQCPECDFHLSEPFEQLLDRLGGYDAEEALAFILQRQNEADGLLISQAELHKMVLDTWPLKLIDVRRSLENGSPPWKGYLRPSQALGEELLEKWPKETAIVFYCEDGHRSLEAARHLRELGYVNAKSLKDGLLGMA